MKRSRRHYSDSMLRTLSDAKYKALRNNVVWDVRFNGRKYREAADRNCLTLSEVNTLLNKPRKGCETTD